MAIVAGNTYTFELTATKDGSAWDLSNATVTFLLRDPSGNVTSFSATVTDAANGVAEYQSAESDLDEQGVWERRWEVDDQGDIKETTSISFYVAEGFN